MTISHVIEREVVVDTCGTRIDVEGGLDGCIVVRLTGELDRADSARVYEALRRAAGSAGLVVVDLARLGFLDVAGFDALQRAQRGAAERGARVVLARAPAHVTRLIGLLGVDGLDLTDGGLLLDGADPGPRTEPDGVPTRVRLFPDGSGYPGGMTDGAKAADASTGADLLTRISNEIVGAQKRFFGKGPTRAKSYMFDDCLFVVMRDGLTTAERTMLEFGQPDMVRGFRQLFENEMTERLTGAIEDITGRKVANYQSQVMFDPDIIIEMFVFAESLDGPPEAAEASGRSDGDGPATR